MRFEINVDTRREKVNHMLLLLLLGGTQKIKSSTFSSLLIKLIMIFTGLLRL